MGKKLNEQRKMNYKLIEFIKEDEAYREKLMKNELKHVKTLIDEYEKLPFVADKMGTPVKKEYSNVYGDIATIQMNLTNAQSNMDAFKVSGEKLGPKAQSLVNACKKENYDRTYKIQWRTAARVLSKFFKNIDHAESSTQTDPDQIAYIKSYYGNQLKNLLDEKIAMTKELAVLTEKLNGMLTKEEGLKHKNDDLMMQIIEKEDEIEKIQKRQLYVNDLAKEKEKQLTKISV